MRPQLEDMHDCSMPGKPCGGYGAAEMPIEFDRALAKEAAQVGVTKADAAKQLIITDLTKRYGESLYGDTH